MTSKKLSRRLTIVYFNNRLALNYFGDLDNYCTTSEDKNEYFY